MYSIFDKSAGCAKVLLEVLLGLRATIPRKSCKTMGWDKIIMNKYCTLYCVGCQDLLGSVSKPHTSYSAFNVEYSLYGMYIGPCIVVSVAGSAGHSYHMPYCHHMHLLSCPIPSPSLSKSSSETMVEKYQQMELERTATETGDERATAMCRQCIATSHSPPQCSTFT